MLPAEGNWEGGGIGRREDDEAADDASGPLNCVRLGVGGRNGTGGAELDAWYGGGGVRTAVFASASSSFKRAT